MKEIIDLSQEIYGGMPVFNGLPDIREQKALPPPAAETNVQAGFRQFIRLLKPKPMPLFFDL